MLNDRSYMRNPQRNGGAQESERFAGGYQALFGLIIANVVFFILEQVPRFDFLSLCLSLTGIAQGRFYQPLTALFIHGSVSHIFFNMFSLYIFGSIIAPRLGAKQFLSLYFFSGIFGNLLWLGFTFLFGSNSILLGASTAVMGITLATAMMAPDLEMLLLFYPKPIKMKTLALVFIAFELLMQFFFRSLSNVAFLAHIGGFAGAYVYMVLFLKPYIRWTPLDALKAFVSGHAAGTRRSPPPGWNYGTPEQQRRNKTEARNPGMAGNGRGDGRVTQKELDYLLDKISRTGINSLSEAEMERLRQAREQMRGQR